MAVLLVLGTAYFVVRVELDGPNLAAKVASLLNKRMRGRIEIGSIEWPASALKTAVSGGWIPVEVRDVKVWDDCALADSNADPEELRTRNPDQDCTPDDRPDPDPKSQRKPRKLLLRTDRVTAELDAHAAMFGNHDLVLRHVVMHGGEALIEQTTEPYPLHAYNRTIVSIVSAFYPRMKAGFRAGIYADQPPPIFDLRDIHLANVNLTVHAAPSTVKDGIRFGMTARIEDVDIDADPTPKNDAYLYMDGRDPLVQKFYFRLDVHGKRGQVRILDEGPREAFRIPGSHGVFGISNKNWARGRQAEYQIDLASVELKRLAQLPVNWSHFDPKIGYDLIANSLEIDGTIRTLPCKSDTGGEPDPKDGAELHITGGLDDYWDRPYDGKWDFHLDATNLGPTVRTCIKSTIGGDHMGGKILVSGPFVALPNIKLDLHDIDVDIPLSKTEEPIKLSIAEMHGGIDLVNDEGYIDESKARERSGKEPGEVMLSAQFGLKPYHARADVDVLKPLDVGRFLPARVVNGVGRYLTGKLSVDGDIETGFSIYNFDLGLGPTAKERRVRLFTTNNGQLFATDYFEHIKLENIRFEGGQSRATTNGRIDYDATHDKWTPDITIEGVYPDLGYWLKMFGLPAFVQSAGGGAVIHIGPNNTVSVNATLKGVPCLDTVALQSTTRGTTTSLKVSSAGFGGTLVGDGIITTPGGDAPAIIEKLHLTGTKLEASKICRVGDTVSGTLDTAELDLKGTIDPRRSPLDWATLAHLYATAKHLSIKGDAYSDVAACLNRPDGAQLCRSQPQAVTPAAQSDCTTAREKGGFCAVARATRDGGGGLDATIASVPANKQARIPAHLGGELDLYSVPMTILDAFVGKDTIGGALSASLQLSGELSAQKIAPTATGEVAWLRGFLGNAFTGDTQLQISPATSGNTRAVLIEGAAMSGALGISIQVGTEAPYPVDAVISGRRVEVDQFMDLSKKLGLSEPVQAWASGTVRLHTELAPKSGKAAPQAWVELTEVTAILDHTSRDGRHVPLAFEFEPFDKSPLAMSLLVTPTTIQLACIDPAAPGGQSPCPAKLDTPAGAVVIKGGASLSGMDIVAQGNLDLGKLGPLLEGQLDAISGNLRLDATLQGTLDKPTYEAKLSAIGDAIVRVAGSDTDLKLAKGSDLDFANGTLSFDRVSLSLVDDRQPAVLNLHGKIGLSGFAPSSWDVKIDGDIAGKLLQIFAPGAIAQASGFARIDGAIELTGAGALPAVHGRVTFSPPEKATQRPPLSVVPRGVRRELSIIQGSLDLTTDDTGGQRSYVPLVDENHMLELRIDGEGRIEKLHGNAHFTDGHLETAEIHLDADNVPFRIPGTLDLTIALNDIELDYQDDTWSAGGPDGTQGTVTIVSGTYQRNFDLAEAIKPVPPAVAPAKPWWDEYPSIGNASLNLLLDVRRFSVANNIAQIELTGSNIDIIGTPRDPRLQGSIVVQRGEFKIPLTRAKFTSTRGTIDFTSNDRAANPSLNIQSDAPDYQDLSGQQHVISLSITGTLEQPLWDLHTNTGLDKSQTLALLFLGRSPEQLRRSLGDQSIGVVNPTAGETSTNPSGTFGDQLVKDLAGDWVSSLLGNSLQKIAPVDILRLELGFGSVGVHAEKKLLENIRLLGDAEQTVRGYSYQFRGEIRTPWRFGLRDRLSLQGTFLNKVYSDPADQALNIQDAQGKFVYRLFIP